MRKLLLSLTALLAFSGVAAASPFVLQSDPTLDNSGTTAFDVSMPGVNYSFYAGPLELNTNNGNFLAYCMDLLHDLTTGTSYNLGPINSGGGAGLSALQTREIAAAANLGFAAWNAKSAGYQLFSEAAQLAIWKIEYAPLNVSISGSGMVQETADFNSILALSVLSNDAGVTGFIPTDLGVTQQMVVQTAVPEASTWAMMLLASPGSWLWALASVVRARRFVWRTVKKRSVMPSWVYTMAACCLAAFILGYVIAWAVEQWRDR